MTRRTLTVLLATAFLAGGTACRASDDGEARAQQAATDDTAAVKAILDSLQSGFAGAPGPEQTARFVTDDAVIAPPGGARWDSLRAALRRDAGASPTLDITPRDTELLGENWAYKLGTTEVSYAPSGARDSLEASVTSLILFRKTPDGWKIHRVVSSSNLPHQITP